jgi:hypothetical protein
VSPAQCRLCGQPLDTTFADLGMSPIANALVPLDQAERMEPFYPLHALVCGSCFLVQLEEFESPESIFPDDYVYYSSFSTSWLDHSRRYTEMVAPRLGLGTDHQVVELASNDGYLLQYFKEAGIPVLGIEPTAGTAQAAAQKGIPTIQRFFGRELADELVKSGTRADLLVANNVLPHVPDLNDFIGGAAMLLADDGVWTIEMPHLQRLVDDVLFDTIYHEHFSYFSFLSARAALAAHDLVVFDVEELPTHGGSLRVYARHAADEAKPVSAAWGTTTWPPTAPSTSGCGLPSASCCASCSMRRTPARASPATAPPPRPTPSSTTAASEPTSSTSPSTSLRTSRAGCCQGRGYRSRPPRRSPRPSPTTCSSCPGT